MNSPPSKMVGGKKSAKHHMKKMNALSKKIKTMNKKLVKMTKKHRKMRGG
jgi:hypothetical protein